MKAKGPINNYEGEGNEWKKLLLLLKENIIDYY